MPEFFEKDNHCPMRNGELHDPFAPEFLAARRRCDKVCRRFNNREELTRRQMVEFWKEMTYNEERLPHPSLTTEDEVTFLEKFPWVERPIRLSYGFNITTGSNVYIGPNCTILDTGKISIGSRTTIGANVSLFGSAHPEDPYMGLGVRRLERGGNITIGEGCLIGGNAIILPDVTIGDGCTIGVGCVVTKDVPPYHGAAGNPAQIVRLS